MLFAAEVRRTGVSSTYSVI